MTVMEFRHRVDKFDIALRHRLAPADKVRVIGKPGSNVAITVECGLSQSRCIKGYSPYYDRSIRLSRGRYAPDSGLFKAVYLWNFQASVGWHRDPTGRTIIAIMGEPEPPRWRCSEPSERRERHHERQGLLATVAVSRLSPTEGFVESKIDRTSLIGGRL